MPKKKKKNTSGQQISPGSLEHKILRYLSEINHKEISLKKVLKRFSKKYDAALITDIFHKLQSKGRITITPDNKIQTGKRKSDPRGARIYEGKVDMTRSGAAYLVCSELNQDVFISRRDTNRAFDGDIVKFIITSQNKKGKPEGKIIEIVKRATDIYIGTVHQSSNFAFVVPDKETMPADIYIPLENLNGAKHGDKVMVRIVDWPENVKNPIGIVLEVLGQAGSNEVEMKSILIENGFPLVFSSDALEEAAAISEDFSEEEIASRRDFRGVVTFTIDPEDAKDFDDALSVAFLENGNVEVGVHIADVSHYVQPDTALDKDAYDRGTSVYLVDRVLPMLPEKISNYICSLRPDEDKLTFSVVFELNHRAEVQHVWYGKTIIRSQKRFTYAAAQEILEGKESEYAKALHTLNNLARQLRAKRMKNGSIAFETTEIRFQLDENKNPLAVHVKEIKDSNRLIEEYMLLANKYVAKYIAKLRLEKEPVPNVYRVHDEPDIVKLEAFAEFARRFGYQLKFEDARQTAFALNALFTKIRGRKEQHVLEQLAIRSMAKAFYSTNNIGHYGLSFEHYSHFTSPIRRYPDLLTHRILYACLNDLPPPYEKDLLEEMCQHVSDRERSAMTAERDSVRYKSVEFLSKRIGDEFNGIISGVIQKGLFVELIENKCEGFVPAEKIGYGSMRYEESRYCLTDLITGNQYHLGDELRVKVIAADIERRQVELAIVGFNHD
jgi:ribonuclease R